MLDINECLDDNAGCDHTCVNTLGSYYCKCNRGYILQADKHNCTGTYVCIYVHHHMHLLYNTKF